MADPAKPAPAGPVKPLSPEQVRNLFQEISTSRGIGLGLQILRMANPDLLVGRQGLRVFETMRHDDQVKAALSLKKYAVLSTGWDVVPPDGYDTDDQQIKIAEFVRHVFEHELEEDLGDYLWNILSALDFGFSVSECVWKPITEGKWAGKIGLRKLSVRPPRSFTFKVDLHDNLAPDGIEQWGRGLPVDRFAVYSHLKEFGNWYGISDLRSAYRCYSEDTEVLTEAGWKDIGGVTLSDRVATLNPTTGNLEYHLPVRKHSYPYQGRMFRHAGKVVDLLVTPNHRMWVTLGHGKPHRFRFIEAEKLPEVVQYKRDAEWPAPDAGAFTLPAVTVRQRLSNHTGRDFGVRSREIPAAAIPMDDWLRFFGIWLAGGYVSRGRQWIVGIAQKAGPKLDRIVGWVRACGFTACVKVSPDGKGVVEIPNRQLGEYLARFGKAPDKHVPAELKALSRRQLRILLEAMWFGDGSLHGYATVSKRLADDVQELLLKAGYAGTVRREEPGPGYFGTYPVYIVSRHVSNLGGTDCSRSRRAWEPYDGTVYCLEVPNHLLYVRRNGKACWCGNSWWFKDNAWKWWGIFLDRYSIPLAEGVLDPSANFSPTEISALETLLKNLQSETAFLHPSDVHIQFPTVGTAQGSEIFEKAIEASNKGIARAILMPQLLGVAEQGRTGSYSQARKQFDVFILVVEKLQRDLANYVLEAQVIRKLVDLNFRTTVYPEFVFLPFTETNEQMLLAAFNQAIMSGAVRARAEDEVHIRQVLDFPKVALEDIEQEQEAGGLLPPPPGKGGVGAPSALGPPGPAQQPAAGAVGAAAGEDPLAAQVEQALGAKGVRMFAAPGAPVSRQAITEALGRLRVQHPDWDDGQLVAEAVGQLEEGRTETDQTAEGGGAGGKGEELSDEDIDALIDEALGGQGEQRRPDEEDQLDKTLGVEGAGTIVRGAPSGQELDRQVRAEHPDWDDGRVAQEVRRRLAGGQAAGVPTGRGEGP